jgi:predicted metal-dependent HD superfamily phosphohydrolase
VEQYILATEKHELLLDDDELRLFLDLDLSILCEDRVVYDRYSEAIRKEYSHFCCEEFNLKRRKVL